MSENNFYPRAQKEKKREETPRAEVEVGSGFPTRQTPQIGQRKASSPDEGEGGRGREREGATSANSRTGGGGSGGGVNSESGKLASYASVHALLCTVCSGPPIWSQATAEKYW
ncbi:Hypothetical protein NTJ_06659 [Nesidiocoris tenuis]|uniref:Uncharacterized protein n=1 Tax=Nesidiocoris tenuis TaxID=355587 RepID=A0ABN7ASI8_9HEMI|nr:Hypothetical protein NTJ_06659 [Nesidiocoris tenuis]